MLIIYFYWKKPKMDQATLDIKYSELLQWLLDRYLIPKDWPNRLEIIKSKKSEIIETLFKSDADDMQKLKKMFKIFETMPIETIPYNDYNKLYQQLTKTKEAKEKTFFGNFKSPFIYNAYILDYLYQKNNLYLAENSKIIIQNVSYEIPNCLKMIDELKSQIEYQKNKNIEKNEEIIKNKKRLDNKLKEKNIDIDIDKVSNSNEVALYLIERIEKNDLFETMLKDIESKIKGNEFVLKGMELYEDFYKSIYENLKTRNENKEKENENNEDKEVKESSTAHNKRGKKHQKYKKPNKNTKKENKEAKEENKENINENNKNIDVKINDFVFETFTPSLKKFYTEGDYLLNSNNENNIENNRQEYINSLVKKYKMKYTEQSDIKDFKFNIVGDNNNSNLNTNSSSNNEKEYKETCLLNHHERNLLLADIKEIISFLEERLSIMESNVELNLTMYLKSLNDFNIKYNFETMTQIKNELSKLVSCLTEKNFVFLCDIFNDENNIKNITDMFNEIKIKNMKLTNLIKNNEKKNGELEVEIKDNQKKINELRKATVNIKKMTEVAVTKLLKRKINIMGDEYLFSK